jgi:hypothetical protein
LTSIEISDSVKSIGTYAFYNCSALTGVYISDMSAWCNISFGDYYANPVYYAKNLYLNDTLVTDLVIPDGVTSIGAYAFRGYTKLTSVEIPDSVTSIGDYAFYGCTGLTSMEIPNSVTSIGANAFYGCTGLTSVTIGNGVTSIGDYAFYGCTGLTSVSLGSNVTSIGNSAFYNCSSLTSVTIPSNVTSIGQYAFKGCSSLTSAVFENTSGWWVAYTTSETSGTNILSDRLQTASTAATYLTDTYYTKYWRRSEEE